ncbi:MULTISPECIES: cobyrinate a,c-diamide synthase [unclassified Pseudodesulfovibrio]|uniref:cobyrinate a,c-diamide synthase n=1 Tax=unclassified Pseudodesulfovibrio TaxID=2661612 RepID=UPI000FEBF968|nr:MULTISPECIES: cobyrinate a,c-diamide synthase [unclassified Pseudodesulfovibrio]MCJ2165875.1 cobyrinate a,c-diamide synthase [Pseudodesulfovibrio sp. S3-i]RWU02694.1 cobyrinate a,c-diamide synthase [Pseudodesulfovibrio sp. S3]
MSKVKAIVMAGTHSGCGKTSISLGLMASLARRGMKVQPFKCGPDFIDPGHHSLACAVDGKPVPSHNLDGWMLDEVTNLDIFNRYAAGCDVAVIEGVMGLFDGISGTEDHGSTGQMAKILGLPVILVVDARSMARSAAALVAGYADFDPQVNIAGVIFNRVGSPSHAELLREAMTLVPDVPVLGCLGRDEEIVTPSRHLGLVTPDREGPDMARYQRLADWVETGLDPDHLLETLPEIEAVPLFEPVPKLSRVTIGLARDNAFCFYYEENLRLLRGAGAKLVEFSPLADTHLPEHLDGLYLGGGYPELYAFELGQNTRLRREIKEFCESGRPVYAECGGFMFLMNDIITGRGRYAMAGAFPIRAEMSDKFRALGYREITTQADTVLGPAGIMARGHEFHYSSIKDNEGLQSVYAMTGRKGRIDAQEGFQMGNVLGSYVHLHFGSRPEMAQSFVRACMAGMDA